MKNKLSQIIIAIILIVLLVLIWNPAKFWMADMTVMLILILLVVIFSIFASFILREKVQDEREEAHRSLAGRAAFLTGSSILMIGILIQGFSHAVDIWLVLALVSMIIVKIGTRLYSDSNF
jgi:hypothetical protein